MGGSDRDVKHHEQLYRLNRLKEQRGSMEEKNLIQIVFMGLLHVLTTTAAAQFPPCDIDNTTETEVGQIR